MNKGAITGLRIVGILAGIAVLIGLGGYLYFRINSPHFLRIARDIEEATVTIALEELDEAILIEGMHACENLYLEQETMRVYVADLGGHIHLLDGESREQLEIVKSLDTGRTGLGLEKGPDGFLYAVLGIDRFDTPSWIEQGGAVYRVDPELDQFVKVTDNFPAMNGLACDNAGLCYFASSNFDFFRPEGNVYTFQIEPDGSTSKPELVFQDVGLANGLHYNARDNRMYLSDTLETVTAFTPGEQSLELVYRKTTGMEGMDDICIDRQGNLWMTSPLESTLKYYNPRTKQLVRYDIEGIGQTSACGIREEAGEEILYVTELNKKRSFRSMMVYDGRGLLVVPVNSLLGIGPDS
jgi:sugar lactone lactonase YvrE